MTLSGGIILGIYGWSLYYFIMAAAHFFVMASNEVENIGKYDDNITADTMVQKMMKCTNADRGCTWQGKLQAFQDHKVKCPKEKVLCSYYQLGCSTHVCQNEQEMHDSDNTVEHLALARKYIQSLMDEIASLRSRVQSVEENHSVMESNINSSKNEVDKKLHARDIEQNQLQEELRQITSKVDESPSQPALPQQPRSLTRWAAVLAILIVMLGILLAIAMPTYNASESLMQGQPESREDVREHQEVQNVLQELNNLVTMQQNFTEELKQLNLKFDSNLNRDELTNASTNSHIEAQLRLLQKKVTSTDSREDVRERQQVKNVLQELNSLVTMQQNFTEELKQLNLKLDSKLNRDELTNTSTNSHIEAELQLLQEKATSTDERLSDISKDISEKIRQQLEEIKKLQNAMATVKHVEVSIAPIMLEMQLLKGKVQVLESVSHNHVHHHGPHHPHHHHHHRHHH